MGTAGARPMAASVVGDEEVRYDPTVPGRLGQPVGEVEELLEGRQPAEPLRLSGAARGVTQDRGRLFLRDHGERGSRGVYDPSTQVAQHGTHGTHGTGRP